MSTLVNFYYARMFQNTFCEFRGAEANYNPNLEKLDILKYSDLPEGSTVSREPAYRKIPRIRVSVIKTMPNSQKIETYVVLYCSSSKLDEIFQNPKQLILPNMRILSANQYTKRARR